jgi:hypothetical protein
MFYHGSSNQDFLLSSRSDPQIEQPLSRKQFVVSLLFAILAMAGNL